MKRPYDLLPELAPILIFALIGLIFWLFSLAAMAQQPMIADYLGPCCASTYDASAEAYRAEQRRHNAEMQHRARQQEMRTIRLEIEAEQQRFRDLVNR